VKKLLTIAILVCVAFSFVACGGSDNATPPAQNNNEGTGSNQDQSSGTTFESKFVNGETFGEWSFKPDEKNETFAWIRHSSNTKFIAFSFVWENTVEPEKYVQDFVDSNKEMNPTKPEKITYGENEYYKISYVNLGYKNVQLVTKKGNLLITVNLQGTGVEEDSDVPKILETLKFKEM
jgi:hypothetical protein